MTIMGWETFKMQFDWICNCIVVQFFSFYAYRDVNENLLGLLLMVEQLHKMIGLVFL